MVMYPPPRSVVSILACAGVASSQCHQSEAACQACGKTSLEYKYCAPPPPPPPPSPATPPLVPHPPSPLVPMPPTPPMPPYHKKPEKHAAKMSERHGQHGEARDADASDEDADASDEDAVVPQQHVHGERVGAAALTQPSRADGDDGVDAERPASGATLADGRARTDGLAHSDHSTAETGRPSGPGPSAALSSQTASSQGALTLGAASAVRTRPPPGPDSSIDIDIGDVVGKESTLSSISSDLGGMDGSMSLEALLVVGLALGAVCVVGLLMMRSGLLTMRGSQVADLWAGLRTKGRDGKVVGEATRRAYEPVVPTVSKEFENDSSEDGDDVSIIY